jgi:hypothetical protein
MLLCTVVMATGVPTGCLQYSAFIDHFLKRALLRETMNTTMQELMSFVNEWVESPEQNKKAFIRLKKYLESLTGVALVFLPRPGLTFSLRVSHVKQKEKPLFVMVDVIEGDPRWLSVCFYGEMISDPDDKGDFVPGGLLGQDARCFDMDSYSEEGIRYLEERIAEAWRAATL